MAVQTFNPKAPHPRRVVIRPTVPAARLKRLGATQPALDVYRAWWENQSTEEQSFAAADLAVLTDQQLREQAEWLGSYPERTSKQVTSWARSAPNRRLAAVLAIVAEALQDSPRAGLLRELEAIS